MHAWWSLWALGGSAGAVEPASDPVAAGWLAERGLDGGVADERVDRVGRRHVRIQQRIDGEVLHGAQAVLHVDAGEVVRVTDGTVDPARVRAATRIGAPQAVALAGMDAVEVERWFLGGRALWRVLGAGGPDRRGVWLDAGDGSVVRSEDGPPSALDRETWDAGHTYQVPGVLVRAEGDPPTGDPVADAAHRNAGVTWAYYRSRHGRDGYDGAGATTTSVVHVGVQLGSAFWDTDRLLLGDGDGVLYRPFALATDVVAHELTHGVIEQTADLVYAGEPGAVNEALADLLGTSAEAFARGWVVDQDTWLFGQDAVLPAAGDAIRYLDDPTLDTVSIDQYARYVDGMDVHQASGVANAAFAAMAGSVALDLGEVGDLWYDALTTELLPDSDFADTRRATVQVAVDRYGAGTPQVAAVESAWDGVGVHDLTVFASQANLSGTAATRLRAVVTSPAGAQSLSFRISGGTGNADLYVRLGAPPSTTVYDCASRSFTVEDHCEIEPATAGDWHVMVAGAGVFSGVTLTVASSLPPVPVVAEVCRDGLDDDADGRVDCDDPDCAATPACDALAAATGDALRLVWERPAGVTRVAFDLDGGTGNADLFVRGGALPTATRFDCAPRDPGNTETCVIDPATDESYHLLIRAASAYSGVSWGVTAN